ncbi:MAG: hypothetical protein HY906_08420 [Deltaproteobacteria bacterium]|nr:hypothetical protein [Deltaproteobacteria bacterium]
MAWNPRRARAVRAVVWTAPLVLGMALARPAATAPTSQPAAVAPVRGPTPSLALAEHVAALKKKAPASFSVVVSPPFVVVGDAPAARLRALAEGRIRWTADRLRQEHFDRELPEILTIWLFRNGASYRRYTRELFGETPTTPFGYYSARDRALVMNIGSGGGTLVHELVHPYVAANFPACPAWLNEGLASLYEGATSRGARIRGLVNWRLPGLQAAIRARRLPTFAQLLATTDQEFYEEDPGTNYAQARFLCLYLQERGLLRRFFREARAAHGRDPGGVLTLRRVLGQPDLERFQQAWEAWVLRLRQA